MKTKKEVLAIYNEVVRCAYGYKVQLIIDGKVKFIGKFKSQKAANNKFESLTKEK
tara:strand:- start:713 stop:877 length:165 start_codon:yes stop_codon:yes gene_type:complete